MYLHYKLDFKGCQMRWSTKSSVSTYFVEQSFVFSFWRFIPFHLKNKLARNLISKSVLEYHTCISFSFIFWKQIIKAKLRHLLCWQLLLWVHLVFLLYSSMKSSRGYWKPHFSKTIFVNKINGIPFRYETDGAEHTRQTIRSNHLNRRRFISLESQAGKSPPLPES